MDKEEKFQKNWRLLVKDSILQQFYKNISRSSIPIDKSAKFHSSLASAFGDGQETLFVAVFGAIAMHLKAEWNAIVFPSS